MKATWIALLLALTLVTGCTDLYRKVYESIRSDVEAHRSPQDRARSGSLPTYDAYKKELDRLEKNGDSTADDSDKPVQPK